MPLMKIKITWSKAFRFHRLDCPVIPERFPLILFNEFIKLYPSVFRINRKI
jgi:hypothetical protein